MLRAGVRSSLRGSVVHTLCEDVWEERLVVGQNGSVKIREIRHVGGLLLCVFFRCCVCWSMSFFFLIYSYPHGGY